MRFHRHRPTGPSFGSGGPSLFLRLSYVFKTGEEALCFPRQRRFRRFRSHSQLSTGGIDLAKPQKQHAEMETNSRGARKSPGQRAEPRERAFGMRLVESADRVGDEGFGIPRRKPCRQRVLPSRRNRPVEPLEREPVEQLGLDVLAPRIPGKRLELGRRGQPGDAAIRAEARDERG